MPSHFPLITVGLPVYNGSHFIAAAIKSIQHQTLGDFELIISDNNSIDDTPQIIAEIAASDTRIRIISLAENLGMAYNHNLVLRQARGKFFHWTAADDGHDPSFLARLVDPMTQDPACALCCSGVRLIDEEGRRISDQHVDLKSRPEHSPSAVLANVFSMSHCWPMYGVFRTDCLKQSGGLGHYRGSDRALLGRFLLDHQARYVAEPLYQVREHKQRFTANQHQWRAWYAIQPKGLVESLPILEAAQECGRAISQVNITRFQQFECYLSIIRWCISPTNLYTSAVDFIEHMMPSIAMKLRHRKSRFMHQFRR